MTRKKIATLPTKEKDRTHGKGMHVRFTPEDDRMLRQIKKQLGIETLSLAVRHAIRYSHDAICKQGKDAYPQSIPKVSR